PFPYTTLFRSVDGDSATLAAVRRRELPIHDRSLLTARAIASKARRAVMRPLLVAATLSTGCFEPIEDTLTGSEGSGAEGTTATGSGGSGAEGPTTAGTTESPSECVAPGECTVPPGFGACADADCVGGRCVVVPKPAGTALPESVQIAGDCQRLACDGAGAIVTLVDDEDLPRDGIDCTLDACDRGLPIHEPVKEGTPCTGGL